VRWWQVAGSVLTAVGAGLLLVTLFAELDAWVGALAGVVLAVGAVCTGAGMIAGAVRPAPPRDPGP
jgi:hypothetical protein